jgi:hypothetical protein
MVARNDDAHKISVRIESGAAGRPRARLLRAAADERRRAGLDHTVIPGRPRPADGDIAVDADVEMIGNRPRAHRSSGSDGSGGAASTIGYPRTRGHIVWDIAPDVPAHGQLAGRKHRSRLNENNATLSRCLGQPVLFAISTFDEAR